MTNTVKNDMQQNTEENMQQLQDAILLSLRKDGIETTLLNMGTSLFMAEAAHQEMTCRISALQQIMIEKGIATPDEIETKYQSVVSILEESLEKQLEELSNQVQEETNA